MIYDSRAAAAEEMMKSDIIQLLTRQEVARIKKDEIICVENRTDSVIIHTKTKAYCIRADMGDLLLKLEWPFYMCHSNCIVNFERLCGIKDRALYMEDGRIISLSGTAYRAARRNYIGYLSGN
jgi:DNA-binding LytR/AlgR family response regulator